MKEYNSIREKFLKYLRKNLDATSLDAKLDGFSHALDVIYKSKLNIAKRDADVPAKYIRKCKKEK